MFSSLWKHVEALTRPAYLVIVVVGAISITVMGIAIHHETTSRINDVQRSRIQVAYDACVETNNRHVATIKNLNKLIEDSIHNIHEQVIAKEISIEEARTRITQLTNSRNSTTLVLNSIVPFRNCVNVIVENFGPKATSNISGVK